MDKVVKGSEQKIWPIQNSVIFPQKFTDALYGKVISDRGDFINSPRFKIRKSNCYNFKSINHENKNCLCS